ncbi:MAG: hypothetical protein ACXQS8_03690 [Candidatus Helarchaeales archaeon]
MTNEENVEDELVENVEYFNLLNDQDGILDDLGLLHRKNGKLHWYQKTHHPAPFHATFSIIFAGGISIFIFLTMVLIFSGINIYFGLMSGIFLAILTFLGMTILLLPSFLSKVINKFSPFGDNKPLPAIDTPFYFWKPPHMQDEALFIENKDELVAIKGFELKSLARHLVGNFEHVIKMLFQAGIPIIYHVECLPARINEPIDAETRHQDESISDAPRAGHVQGLTARIFLLTCVKRKMKECIFNDFRPEMWKEIKRRGTLLIRFFQNEFKHVEFQEMKPSKFIEFIQSSSTGGANDSFFY